MNIFLIISSNDLFGLIDSPKLIAVGIPNLFIETLILGEDMLKNENLCINFL